MVKYLVVSMLLCVLGSAFAETPYAPNYEVGNRDVPAPIIVSAPAAGATLVDGAPITVTWTTPPAGAAYDRFVILLGNTAATTFFLDPFAPVTDKAATTATATLNAGHMASLFSGSPLTGYFFEIRAEKLDANGTPVGEAAVGRSGNFSIPAASGGTTPPPTGTASILGPIGPADTQANSTERYGVVLAGVASLDGMIVAADWGDGNSGASGFSQSTRDANGNWHLTREHTYHLTPNVANQPNEASFLISWTLTFPSGQVVKYSAPVHVVQPARFIIWVNADLKYNPIEDSGFLPTIPGYTVVPTYNKKTGVLTGFKFKKK